MFLMFLLRERLSLVILGETEKFNQASSSYLCVIYFLVQIGFLIAVGSRKQSWWVCDNLTISSLKQPFLKTYFGTFYFQ